MSNRIVTPNGDGRNDTVTFRIDNPRDSAGEVRIYDSLGRQVAAVAAAWSGAGSEWIATWDARSNGTAVPSGVYVYVVLMEQRTYSGTLLVIR